MDYKDIYKKYNEQLVKVKVSFLVNAAPNAT